MSIVSRGRFLVVTGAAGALLALSGCSGDAGLTSGGPYETEPEAVAALIEQTQDGSGRAYCEMDTGDLRIDTWLRGQDDFTMVADDRVGMTRDPDAVTFWDTDQGVALEVLIEELGLMGLDPEGISSAAVFENMAAGPGGAVDAPQVRCRELDEVVYPDLEGVRVYTMMDVQSGEMPEPVVESLFTSFEEL